MRELSLNYIDVDGAKAISESLKFGKLNNIEILNLNSNFITVDGVEVIFNALEHGNLKKLRQLNINIIIWMLIGLKQ